MKRFLPFAFFPIALISACNSGSSSSTPAVSATLAPATYAVNGTYTGAISDTTAGSGTETLTLTQSGNTISGSFSNVFPSNTNENNSGTVSGTVSGTAIALTLTSSNTADCPFAANGTVNAGNIQGTYTVFNCGATTDTGSFNVTN